jgi:energy-coupling factor transport system substrate-specific component
MAWVSRQFSTRVIVLMPVAIAINIVLGYTVGYVLKLPIYLDSIGTILVGVLAGPLAGAATGILSNLIWQYAPFVSAPNIGPFAIVAGVIGLLAGIWGYVCVYRRRPSEAANLWIPVIIAIAIILFLASRIYNNPAYQSDSIVPWYSTAILVIAIVVSAAVAIAAYLRRDAAPAWVAVAGALTGIVAAFVSAPIAAIAYGGVTGGGTDVIVAALRQGGADVLNASLGQGFFSDPIDKVITSFVVYIVLAGLSRRIVARYPLGERTVGAEYAT